MRWAAPAALLLSLASSAAAQTAIPNAPLIQHRFHSLELGPGVVGQQQLLRVPNALHYFQPVELRGPAGSQISMAGQGGFLPSHQQKLKVGLRMGHVYRFRIGAIPLLEGYEVFPTVELINRLHPPAGMAEKFPIPIELTREELEMAISGHLVTRVIYLEDPAIALAAPETDEQRYFDVDRRIDPLHMADRLGRPMAILRMGSRVPLGDGDPAFTHAPPAVVYAEQVDTRLDRNPVPAEEVPTQPPAAESADGPADVSAANGGGAERIGAEGGPALNVRPAARRQPLPARYPRLPTRYELGDTPRSSTR